MKTYCLDTSAIIENPNIIEYLGDNEIIIPFCVLNELDNLRKKSGEVRKNARKAIRNIEKYSIQGKLFDGVKTEFGGLIRCLKSDFNKETNDLKIIACAEWLKSQEWANVILLSNDIGLRVIAATQDIKSEGISKPKNVDYSGIMEITLSQDLIDKLHINKKLLVPLELLNVNNPLYQNQMLIITNIENISSTLARVEEINGFISLHKVEKNRPWGITPANVEQIFAVDLLMNPYVELVSLIGKAGTGKNYISIASALEQVLEMERYDQIIVMRPTVSVGKDIGFLPGTLAEKLEPWAQPIKDNLMDLLKGNQSNMEMFFDCGKIKIEAISHIRGRTISNSFILIDEAQNLSLDQLKTIITRSAEGSKIVLTGDIEQVDLKELKDNSNGLTKIIEAFKDQSIAGHIKLTKCKRSKLASIASQIL